jgi:UDP-N-acetylmuramyl pentapeptide phosphotransferase/UDP-N-acetylglucosamine-1-phosphate transferase
MISIKFITGLLIHYIINIFFSKKKFLLDDTESSDHKKFVNNNLNIVLSGGIVFFLLFLFFTSFNLYLKLFVFLIFLIGILSDLKILNSPSLRLLLQFFVVGIFVILLEIGIDFTGLYYLDLTLKYKLVSIIFSTLCFLILINGSNFIDGLNTLIIGYYILVLSSLYFLVSTNSINYNLSLINNTILILVILLVFNILNKSFIGDSGAYTISCVVGFICINFFKNIAEFSVLFIVVILWYPAFETLFSLLRKLIFKTKPTNPDNHHLHHLIFTFCSSKIKTKIVSNIFTALIINSYNLFVFIIAMLNYKNSVFLSFILITNILIYLYLYKFLKNEK